MAVENRGCVCGGKAFCPSVYTPSHLLVNDWLLVDTHKALKDPYAVKITQMKTLSRSVIHTLQGRCIDEQTLIFVLHTHQIHTQTSAVVCPKSTPCPLILCCVCLVNPLEVSLTKGFPSAF